MNGSLNKRNKTAKVVATLQNQLKKAEERVDYWRSRYNRLSGSRENIDLNTLTKTVERLKKERTGLLTRIKQLKSEKSKQADSSI